MNNSPLTIKIGDEVAQILALRKSRYINTGRIAVTAVMLWPDGIQDEAKVSVNLDHDQPIQSKDLPRGQFAVRTDNESAPLYQALSEAGWLEKIGEAPSGYVICDICKLTDRAILA